MSTGEQKQQPDAAVELIPSDAREEAGVKGPIVWGPRCGGPRYALSPTLECDGGNDAATAAAVMAGGPDPLLPGGRRLPGARLVLVTSRRIDGEAQLCIA